MITEFQNYIYLRSAVIKITIMFHFILRANKHYVFFIMKREALAMFLTFDLTFFENSKQSIFRTIEIFF